MYSRSEEWCAFNVRSPSALPVCRESPNNFPCRSLHLNYTSLTAFEIGLADVQTSPPLAPDQNLRRMVV